MGTKLWQNFLKSSKYRNFIKDKIIDEYTKLNCNHLVEIWPWKWVITKYLVNEFSDISLFEKDTSLISYLQEILVHENQKIYNQDILLSNLSNFDENKTFIFGNIPYYITSPIIRKFFVENNFVGWILLIQKEVWEKISTNSSKKSYLRWLVNFKNNVYYLKKVPSNVFSPKPKIDSCLIKIEYDLKKNKDINYEKFLEFINLYSSFSRKTLWKSTKILEKKKINKFIIPDHVLQKRLENLTREELKVIINNQY